MYPQILYWKWNDELLENGVLENKANDIINRSCFTHIYVAPHSMVSPDASLLSPIMQKKLSDFAEIMHKNGRKAVYDIDIRTEPLTFFERCKKTAAYSYMVTAKLDENGKAVAELIPYSAFDPKSCRADQPDELRITLGRDSVIDGILGAWCVDELENGRFNDANATPIKQYVTITEKNGILYAEIDATKANAGRDVILYPRYFSTTPDVLCDEYLECEAMLLNAAKDIALDGVCVDEWGIRPIIKDNCIRFVYTTPATEKLYKEYCGRELSDDLLYFFAVPKNDAGKSVRIVNDYMTVLRRRELEGEQLVYDLTKKLFGKDAFVGCHPTWWGSNTGLSFEAIRNGMDWWETPRDYAQTDECVPISIRNSMARTKPEPVWYNMWYSQRTMDLNTYFRETWVNARFGGRTHHLGYECYEPGVVLTLREEGRLEKISAMEEQIAKLNAFQKAKPDARVLMLFGMEAFTNWNIQNPGADCISYAMKGNGDTLLLSKELFAEHFLHDLVPTTEIDRGMIEIKDNKAVYGGHTYDAVVVVNPNGCSKKAIEFIDNYAKANDTLIVCGECEYYSDGSRANNKFATENYFEKIPEGAKIAEILRSLGVAGNMTDKLCVFEDNSVIATTDGAYNIGNELKVDFEIDGHKVSFEGKDFVAVRIENGKPEAVFGEAGKLEIDGKSLL